MIETKRLLIKPLTEEELRKHIDSPGDLAKELDLTFSQSLAENEMKEAILMDFLPNIADPSKDPHFYTLWIVIEKSEKAIIGGICFHGEPNERGETEIGYGTDYSYRNRGYMTETITGLIEWVRQYKKDVKFITAETERSNISSVKVLEKNGFEADRQVDDSIVLRLRLI
jgi:[ribosomal protein S5]-alanine N-acetyltransferase